VTGPTLTAFAISYIARTPYCPFVDSLSMVYDIIAEYLCQVLKPKTGQDVLIIQPRFLSN
jgi:hypothetical protein